MLAHALNIDPESFMLPDFVSLSGPLGDGDQQILHLFVVDLHHGDHDFVFPGFVVIGCDAVKYLLTGNWNYPLS